MRKSRMALLALFCAATLARGQGTPPPSPPPAKPDDKAADTTTFDPVKNKLDRYLQQWEDSMKKVETMAVSCSRTEVDKLYSTRKTYAGTIHFKKPTQFFWDLKVKDKPQDFERFIGTGQYVYQFLPSQKEIRVYPAPKTTPDGRIADDSSLAFLFGMKGTEAKKRYELSLYKEDADYIYLDVVPRAAVDKADFAKARIVLNKDSYLPRQLWFEQPNRNEVMWDLTTVESPAKQIDPRWFAAPKTPDGWKMVQGQAPAQGTKPAAPADPRIARPQQP